MRDRVGRLGLEQSLFENVTDALGRLFVKTIRKFLVNLKRHHPDRYRSLDEVAGRYEEKNDGQFAVKPSE